MLVHRLCVVSVLLAGYGGLAPVAEAQEGGATVVLDGTLTFEGRATITIPPGYESLPPPTAPVAPPPVVVAPPPPVVVAPPAAVAPPPVVVAPPPPPVLEIMAPPANVPPSYAPPSYAPPPSPAFALPDTTEIEAPRMRRRWGLVVTGVCIFLGGYGVGLGFGLSGETNAWPLIPLVGSLIGITQDDDDLGRIAMFAVSTGLQVAGLIMAIVGTATRRPVRERARAEVTATPVVGDGYVGMAVGGSF